jgi:hypothetical protein
MPRSQWVLILDWLDPSVVRWRDEEIDAVVPDWLCGLQAGADEFENVALAPSQEHEPRRTCLIYGTTGEDFVVVAPKGGADEDPDWFKNLQADPSAGVTPHP